MLVHDRRRRGFFVPRRAYVGMVARGLRLCTGNQCCLAVAVLGANKIGYLVKKVVRLFVFSSDESPVKKESYTIYSLLLHLMQGLFEHCYLMQLKSRQTIIYIIGPLNETVSYYYFFRVPSGQRCTGNYVQYLAYVSV